MWRPGGTPGQAPVATNDEGYFPWNAPVGDSLAGDVCDLPMQEWRAFPPVNIRRGVQVPVQPRPIAGFDIEKHHIRRGSRQYFVQMPLGIAAQGCVSGCNGEPMNAQLLVARATSAEQRMNDFNPTLLPSTA